MCCVYMIRPLVWMNTVLKTAYFTVFIHVYLDFKLEVCETTNAD